MQLASKKTIDLVLASKKYDILVSALKAEGIITIEQLYSIDLLAFMDSHNIFPWHLRRHINRSIIEILKRCKNESIAEEKDRKTHIHMSVPSCLHHELIADTYNVSTYENYVPTSVSLLGKKVDVEKWADVLPAACDLLFEKDPYHMNQLTNQGIGMLGKPIVSSWAGKFTKAASLRVGAYVDATIDAKTTLQYIGNLLNRCNLPKKAIVVYMQSEVAMHVHAGLEDAKAITNLSSTSIENEQLKVDSMEVSENISAPGVIEEC